MRAVAHLAGRPGFVDTIGNIAAATDTPAPYLRKVVAKLRDRELLKAQRGIGGGIRLLVDPSALTILDVLNAVDPLERIQSCPLGMPNHVDLCPLHAELDAAIARIEFQLQQRTIGELLSKRRETGQCLFPKHDELHEL